MKHGVLIVALALAAGVLYLGAAASAGEGLAFPLDDAWIHQTYARNLARTGEWAFVPGQPSAGSTAPLWTLVLATGYVAGLDGVWWSHALGLALLAGNALLAARLARALFPGRPQVPFAAALLVASEWHLVWAAVSGMETLLFSALTLALVLAVVERRGPVALGLLGGLLTLTRPEGMVLFGMAVVGAAKSSQGECSVLSAGFSVVGFRDAKTVGRLVRHACVAGIVFALLVAPLMWFNWQANGTPFPNTFAAKQQEYRALLEQPYLARYATLVGAALLGTAGLALAGLACAALLPDARPEGGPAAYLGLAWCAVALGLYAWRLPVTYQHGRYVMPVIPLLLVYGTAGLLSAGMLARPARVVVGALLLAVPLAFLVVGARAYAADVRVINREMVAAAQWVRDHTPEDALVAAHDVGALGYFAQRPLVDLAGLVSLEVVPYMGDEPALAAFVRQRGAAYLVQGAGFAYPTLTGRPPAAPCGDAGGQPAAGAACVYTTAGLWDGAGGPHMQVWRLLYSAKP
jgi:hypothetical protein